MERTILELFRLHSQESQQFNPRYLCVKEDKENSPLTGL